MTIDFIMFYDFFNYKIPKSLKNPFLQILKEKRNQNQLYNSKEIK